MVRVFARSDNGKKIIILDGDLNSLRCRQRSRYMNNEKVKSMNFASFKETAKSHERKSAQVYGPYKFYSMSRL